MQTAGYAQALLYTFLVVSFTRGEEPGTEGPRLAQVKIEIAEGAASRLGDLFRSPTENVKPNGVHMPSAVRVCLNSIAKVVDGQKIRLIRVERYEASRFPSPEAVRKALLTLWDAEVDTPERYVLWAEQSVWSIQCRLEWKNGKSARLITDGWHSCYQGFSRISMVLSRDYCGI